MAVEKDARCLPALKDIADRDPNTKVVRFRRNFGQTAAMQAGIQMASGDVIATVDGDLQNDPDDIPMMLDKLDEMGIADDTIVLYSTDNGAETVSWPDGGTTPFHGEKGTTWEGGFRVPLAIRWPGTIKPGTIYNDIISHEDWMPTLLHAAGVPGIVDKLKEEAEDLLRGRADLD